MADISWTKSQEEAIYAKGGNILVSAAAGSGKTAVLVERVASKITDPENPVSIEDMVIITFTRAAAAQMRDKIYRRLKRELGECGEESMRSRLKRQIILVQSARIMTIDALCQSIVRERFQDIDIDPGFRLAEQNELEILKKKLLSQLIEERYAKGTESFMTLADYYTDRDDNKLEEITLQLHEFAQSHPEPEAWMKNCNAPYETAAQTGFECKSVVKEITDFTLEFSERLSEAKKERRIAEFSDVAHYCLQILIEKEKDGTLKRSADGDFVYTKAADDMARGINEIIIDEYQDTNELQECIVNALSAERFGRADVFMVGDVKQSIYSFRMACPELFTEKYDSYPMYEGGKAIPANGAPKTGASRGRKIILDANFRSRPEIIDFINGVFSRMMIKEAGGIDYLDGNILTCASQYPPAAPEPAGEAAGGALRAGGEVKKEAVPVPEIIMVDGSDASGKPFEAYMICEKITELLKNGKVTGKDGALRKAEYGDIAVLTRTSSNEDLEQMLTAFGIPFFKESSSGFLQTFEIRLALNLLSVIDNPFRNIQFAAVLTSPLAGVTGKELSEIAARFKESRPESEMCMYRACEEFVSAQNESRGEEDSLSCFMERLKKYRRLKTFMSLSELIEYVFGDSGFFEILEAMPEGEGRAANAAYLLSIAKEYEKNSGAGLYGFIRYMENTRSAESDFAKAAARSSERAVKLMTIHKSKGLEFPIVILAGAGKNYNKTDQRTPVVLDRRKGIGLKARDTKKRTVRNTPLLTEIIEQKNTDLYAEEMRLLYVALTRAKERLIITGVKSGIKKNLCKTWCERASEKEVPLSKEDVTDAGCYLKVLGQALAAQKDAEAIRDAANFGYVSNENLPECRFTLEIADAESIEEKKNITYDELMARRARLTDMCKPSRIPDAAAYMAEETAENAPDKGYAGTENDKSGDAAGYTFETFKYKYEEATRTPVKSTASGIAESQSRDVRLYEFEELSGDWAFAPQRKKDRGEILTGSERGNAYHRFFELFDYSLFYDYFGFSKSGAGQSGPADPAEEPVKIIEAMLRGFLDKKLISKEYADALDTEKTAAFITGELGKRMCLASYEGRLKREQQFVMSAPFGDDIRLIQGIIDAFFTENGEAVVVDYKTDRKKSRAQLLSEYTPQLEIYAEAVERALDLPVKETIIYSTELGEGIKTQRSPKFKPA